MLTALFWLRRGAALAANALGQQPFGPVQKPCFGLLLALTMLVTRIRADLFGGAGLVGVTTEVGSLWVGCS